MSRKTWWVGPLYVWGWNAFHDFFFYQLKSKQRDIMGDNTNKYRSLIRSADAKNDETPSSPWVWQNWPSPSWPTIITTTQCSTWWDLTRLDSIRLYLTQFDATWLKLTQLDSNWQYSPCHAQVWINLDLPLITELHCREEEADKAIDGSDVSRPRNLGKVSCAQAIVKSKAVSGKCQRGEENYNMIIYFMHDAM